MNVYIHSQRISDQNPNIFSGNFFFLELYFVAISDSLTLNTTNKSQVTIKEQLENNWNKFSSLDPTSAPNSVFWFRKRLFLCLFYFNFFFLIFFYLLSLDFISLFFLYFFSPSNGKYIHFHILQSNSFIVMSIVFFTFLVILISRLM